jgi:FkbM family methyltransferase
MEKNLGLFTSDDFFSKALHCYEEKGSFSKLNHILPLNFSPDPALHKVLRLLTKLRDKDKQAAKAYAQECEQLFTELIKGKFTVKILRSIQVWSYFYLLNQLSLLGENEYLKRFEKCRCESFSTNSGTDLEFIKNILNKKKKGFFVEVGGHDGISGSYSLLLEKDLEWNGICIEASPWQFEKMKRVRNCICEQVALGQSDSKEEFYDFSNSMNQRSSLKKHHRNDAKSQSALNNNPYTCINVDVVPFDLLVKKHKISQIDFFIIDVEGAEFEVIKGIDFNNVQVHFFLIEQPSKELNDYLKNKGYGVLANTKNDTLFAHKNANAYYQKV